MSTGTDFFTSLLKLPFNLMTILILVIFLGSVLQGASKGANGSAQQLLRLVLYGVVTVISLLVSWKLMGLLSPMLRDWLIAKQLVIPSESMNWFRRMFYTFFTGLRDFSLMRSALIFLVSYASLKNIILSVIYLYSGSVGNVRNSSDQGKRTLLSTVMGGVIGSLTGAGRSLMMIAVLFISTALFPQAAFTKYIEDSSLYQKGATEIIRPMTGDFIAKQLPVFTKAVEQEFASILKRKYEVLDAKISDNVAAAAKEVTANSQTDEAKAKALYQWIGTRVIYDWDKVKLYEQHRIWKEQTPEDTFRTKKGVCIDNARLYAVMARSVGLDVKVITGLGYNGQGSFGPHAWNEVYLTPKNVWVPLDSTWVSSGGNWFNPPKFNETHIKDA